MTPRMDDNYFFNILKSPTESLVTISSPCPDQISTTWDALMYLKNIFPTHGVYRHHIPPIMWKSQLYALIENRTDVDRTLVSEERERGREFNDPTEDELKINFTHSIFDSKRCWKKVKYELF